MGYTFRTPGPWGPGIAEDLTPEQVDANFWQAIQDIAAKAVQGVGISNFVVAGNQMTVVLTDHTLLGPYPLPIMTIEFKGEWAANVNYFAGDIITHGGSTYMVEVNHLSAATFDPGANDGRGNDYYNLILGYPALSIPTGGAPGTFLRKITGADFVTGWETVALETDLSDVSITAPAQADVLTYDSGIWTNAPPATSTLTLENLTDVVITSPTDGQVLSYTASSSTWVNKIIQTALAALSDVALTTPLAGQPLVYNGTKWTDAATVDMPCGGLNSVSGAITINRSAGEVQRFSLTGTVTLTSITGWPAGGQFARLVIEVQNTGAFGFAWPSIVKWPSGSVPAATANGKDVFILVSFDGGTTIYGNVCGQNFL